MHRISLKSSRLMFLCFQIAYIPAKLFDFWGKKVPMSCQNMSPKQILSVLQLLRNCFNCCDHLYWVCHEAWKYCGQTSYWSFPHTVAQHQVASLCTKCPTCWHYLVNPLSFSSVPQRRVITSKFHAQLKCWNLESVSLSLQVGDGPQWSPGGMLRIWVHCGKKSRTSQTTSSLDAEWHCTPSSDWKSSLLKNSNITP